MLKCGTKSPFPSVFHSGPALVHFRVCRRTRSGAEACPNPTSSWPRPGSCISLGAEAVDGGGTQPRTGGCVGAVARRRAVIRHFLNPWPAQDRSGGDRSRLELKSCPPPVGTTPSPAEGVGATPPAGKNSSRGGKMAADKPAGEARPRRDSGADTLRAGTAGSAWGTRGPLDIAWVLVPFTLLSCLYCESSGFSAMTHLDSTAPHLDSIAPALLSKLILTQEA